MHTKMYNTHDDLTTCGECGELCSWDEIAPNDGLCTECEENQSLVEEQ